MPLGVGLMADTMLNSLAKRPAARLVLRAAMIAAAAVTLAGCYQTHEVSETIPNDYRQRHPISIVEGERTMVVYVGSQRSGLTPVQRADVMAFSHAWRNEATGSVIIDVPANTPNARTAEQTAREIVSMLKAVDIPAGAIRIRQYNANDLSKVAAIRVNYSRVMAQAGPCGLWPKDLGPDADMLWEENRPYWNFGCATQHNFAAMIDNPSDLAQPRAETPAYSPRRSQMLEKYRTGQTTGALSANPNKGRITDVGQ